MPNHCHNRVTFYSEDTTAILKLHKIFSKALKNDDITETRDTVFGSFVPEPDWTKVPLNENTVKEYSWDKQRGEVGELPVFKDKGFGSGLYFESTGVNDDRWYNWRNANWGTKWDAYSLEIDDCDMPNGFEVNFETAWSPPEEIHTAICEQFDDLSVSWFYDEPGCEVAGYL
jgi:hypothetical protein